MTGETKSQRAGEAAQAEIHKGAYGTGKDQGRAYAGGIGTACGAPPEESRPAGGKAGGKEKRPTEKESQLARTAPCPEEQKKHCGNVHNRLWNPPSFLPRRY